jgi:uncharacterized protein (DUF1015 family)
MATISSLRALVPAVGSIPNPLDFFNSAKKKFPQYVKDGFYAQTGVEALYIYRIQRAHRSHTGLIACANVLDYVHGHIKKHENTISAKEDKMLGLFYERNAMIKPILLTYPNAMEIDALINRLTIALPPSFSIPFGDETHVFWEISDHQTQEQLVDLFQNYVPNTYICDGHHRAASSERLYLSSVAQNPKHTGSEPYNFFLAAYFPISEVEVHNYNRYVQNIGMSAEQFLQKLEPYFYVIPSLERFKPQRPHQIGMFLNRSWYRLDIKEQLLAQLKKASIKDRLDVQMLNTCVLEGVLGMKDVRTDENIQYVETPEGISGLEAKVLSSQKGAGFCMYPVALEDLLAIANADGTMPPKSTWIEPRMRNGFLVQTY